MTRPGEYDDDEESDPTALIGHRVPQPFPTVLEILEFLKRFPSFQHCRTGIGCDAVDSIEMAIAKGRQVVFDPFRNVDCSHLSRADILRAPVEGAGRGMYRNIDNTSAIDIGTFVGINVEKLCGGDNLVDLVFELHEGQFKEWTCEGLSIGGLICWIETMECILHFFTLIDCEWKACNKASVGKIEV